MSDKSQLLSLAQIASWQDANFCPKKPELVARVPSLQRGPVWEPAQFELLWDSLLRGFPIGSLMVWPRLPGTNQRAKDPSTWEEDVKLHPITHLLLDGQQRCNAIALGFVDPFKRRHPKQALWLDLQPSDASSGSTRTYWVHATTTPHPWGYRKNDAADPLEAAAIRKALQEYGWRDTADEFKELRHGPPAITEAWPYKARVPVPLAWLLSASAGGAGEKLIWQSVLEIIEEGPADPLKWKEAARKFIMDPSSQGRLNEIELALRRVHAYRLFVQEVPPIVLGSPSAQEDSSEEKEDISNVEHLFQRLNRMGTRLEGDELAYSMIKAYLPELEDPIEQFSSKLQLMPGANLAVLGTRLALTDLPDSSPLVDTLSVARMRAIAGAQNAGKEGPATAELKAIRAMFGTREDSEIGKVLMLINGWLVYRPDNQSGVPKVIRTEIARKSPSVFLLLMWLARRALKESGTEVDSPELARSLSGLATALHWFGLDKARSAQLLYNHLLAKPVCRASFRGVLKGCVWLEGRQGRFGSLALTSRAREMVSSG